MKQSKNRFKLCTGLGILLSISTTVLAAEAPSSEISRKDAATALVNQNAVLQKVKMNAKLDAFIKTAPSTGSLINTGKALAGSVNIGADVIGLVDSNLKDSHTKVFSEDIFLNQYQQRSDKTEGLNFSEFAAKTKITKAESDRAQKFIRNVTMPFPKFVPSSSRTGSGANEFAEQLASQATMSLALNSFYNMFAIRQTTNDTSFLESLERESTWRFVDRDNVWYSAIATTSYEGLLREYAQMEAFNLAMDFEAYKQGERLEALLAANVSSKVKLSSVLSRLVTMLEQTRKLSASAENQ